MMMMFMDPSFSASIFFYEFLLVWICCSACMCRDDKMYMQMCGDGSMGGMKSSTAYTDTYV